MVLENEDYRLFIILYEMMEIFSGLHDRDCKRRRN